MLTGNRISIFIAAFLIVSVFFLALPQKGTAGVISQLGCCLDLGVPICEGCGDDCASLLDECNTGFLHNSYCGSDGASCVVAQEGDLGCCIRPDGGCIDTQLELEQCEIADGVEWMFGSDCSQVAQCPRQRVEFFTDQGEFNELCTDLALEDFEGSNVAPFSSESCPNPINSMTNNACYSPGALIPGFSILAGDPPMPAQALIVLGPGNAGLTDTAVGAQSSTSSTIAEFDDANAAGVVFIIQDPGAPVDTFVTLEVFGPGNTSLGTTAMHVTDTAEHFIGVRTGFTPIERVVLDTTLGVEYITTLSFGDCGTDIAGTQIPTLSEWGLIAIAGILGVVALLVVIRRKKAAA